MLKCHDPRKMLTTSTLYPKRISQVTIKALCNRLYTQNPLTKHLIKDLIHTHMTHAYIIQSNQNPHNMVIKISRTQILEMLVTIHNVGQYLQTTQRYQIICHDPRKALFIYTLCSKRLVKLQFGLLAISYNPI